MFDRNVFNNKIPNAKHSHLWNGSRLTLQTAHQSTFNHSLVTSFLFDVNENLIKKNYFKCYFYFFTFEFNILDDKIPEMKHSHLSNGSQLTSQTAHFPDFA